jgi:hypothetical protein
MVNVYLMCLFYVNKSNLNKKVKNKFLFFLDEMYLGHWQILSY